MSATTTTVVNGILPSAQDTSEELASFEKILKLRDLVFTGNHPRLSVPAHLVRKISPQLSSQSTSAVVPPQFPIQHIAQSQLPGLSITHEQAEEQERKSKVIPNIPTQPTTTLSGINPVLLAKSADLIKAENTLLRQRLEKQLRDQFEQKRLDFRKRPAPAEAKPDFDISALLAKALDIAKPIALSQEQSEKDDEDESFDENSLYSSRAPDSTPDPRGQSPPSPEQVVQSDVGANRPADAASSLVARSTGDAPQQLPPQNTNDALPMPKPIAPTHLAEKSQENTDSNAMELDDEDEEGEYSPPEAMDQYPAQNGGMQQTIPDPRSRQMRRYSDLDHNGKRAASPSEPNVRIVRNHITSPIAPQPSRVSPLALTKDSLVSQDRRYQNGYQRGRADSRSQSPEETIAQRNKRRKLEKRAEKKARRGVKPEPISPPPFHDIQPLGQTKLPPQDNRPIVIEDHQPQEIRYVETAPRYLESPQRPPSRAPEQLIPINEPRVLSRATMRPPRDDQDLRRVASLHNMRAETAREYVEYATPARTRATSYVRVESPMREMPQYRQDDRQQEVRVVRTPAPEYRDVYSQPEPEVRYIPEPMPMLPRERIVVDQYGRRFREIVQERQPVTPHSASAYIEREGHQYYDSYSQARVGPVLEEGHRERFEPEMPPPRMVRPAVDPQSDTSGLAHTGAYERLPSSRGDSVMYERAPRQTIYAEPPADFRSPVRMSSVRPPPAPPSQYEEATVMQMTPRASSTRPGREGSVFVDDRGSVRREYVPIEQARFRVVEAEGQPRYVDAQGRELIAAAHDEGGVRYVQRY